MILKAKNPMSAIPMSTREYHEDYLGIEHPVDCGNEAGFLVTLGYDEFEDSEGKKPNPIVQWMPQSQFNYIFTVEG